MIVFSIAILLPFYLLLLGVVCFFTFVITLIIKLLQIGKMSHEIYPGRDIIMDMIAAEEMEQMKANKEE